MHNWLKNLGRASAFSPLRAVFELWHVLAWWAKHLPTISLVFCLGFCLLTFSQVLLGWPGVPQWSVDRLRTRHVNLQEMEIRLHVCKQNKSSHWQGGIIFFFSWEPSISADCLLALAVLGGGVLMSCICSAPPPQCGDPLHPPPTLGYLGGSWRVRVNQANT